MTSHSFYPYPVLKVLLLSPYYFRYKNIDPSTETVINWRPLMTIICRDCLRSLIVLSGKWLPKQQATESDDHQRRWWRHSLMMTSREFWSACSSNPFVRNLCHIRHIRKAEKMMLWVYNDFNYSESRLMSSLVNGISRLMWSHYESPFTIAYYVHTTGYCYHSFNVITFGLAQSDHIDISFKREEMEKDY